MRTARLLTAALLTLAAPAALPLAIGPAAAHHGWAWATDAEFEVTGRVKSVVNRNPHGTMVLAGPGGDWRVEIGQPWRNERAGLSMDLLEEGTTVTVHGHRSAKEGERLVKAERLVIAGKDYNLYPDRTS